MKLSLSTITFAGAAVLALGSLVSTQLFAFGDQPVNQQPHFTDAPCEVDYFLVPGQQLCFSVNAIDPEQDFIVLQWNNTPFSATTNPPCPTGGQGSVFTQFCWTPGIQDIGQSYLVAFDVFQPGNTLPFPKCDIHLHVQSGLSAEVTSLTGKTAFAGGPIVINWETSSEIDNAYFNVYRSESTFENAVQVNAQPIVAKGSPITPASYSQGDRRAKTGHAYHYWLESVDIYGETQLFGPVNVVAR